MRLKDEKRGILWVERVGICRSWGILARNFFLETRVRVQKHARRARAASHFGECHAGMVELSDSNRVWNWAWSWCFRLRPAPDRTPAAVTVQYRGGSKPSAAAAQRQKVEKVDTSPQDGYCRAPESCCRVTEENKTIFPGNAGSVQKRRKSLTSCWQSSRPLPLSEMPHAVMVQLSDSNRVWNWALSW